MMAADSFAAGYSCASSCIAKRLLSINTHFKFSQTGPLTESQTENLTERQTEFQTDSQTKSLAEPLTELQNESLTLFMHRTISPHMTGYKKNNSAKGVDNHKKRA